MKVSRRVSVLCVMVLAWFVAAAAEAKGPDDEPYGSHRAAHSSDAPEEADSDGLLSEGDAPDPTPEEETGSKQGATPWENVAADGGDTCDECGGDCDTCGCSRGCHAGLWFGSVDYLLFRPRMSQAVAEVRQVTQTDSSTSPILTTTTNSAIQFPITYQSAYRVAAGYRSLDCGGDFQVAYWRMTNDAHYSDGPAGNGVVIFGNLDNNADASGEFLNSSTGVIANIYDVDFGKSISMGGSSGGCTPCGGCPRWDLRFFGGARFADITRFNTNVVTNSDGAGLGFGVLNSRFVGGGPRAGIQGRRFFGPRSRLSGFMKASQALLIGDYRVGRSSTLSIASPAETLVTNESDRFQRMVPVTDIEIGGSWQLAPYTFVSVGYFFQCWWDLGQGEAVSGSNTFSPLDTSNILSFDGLFARAEILY